MVARYELPDVPKLHKRAIFVDANVLIYLFWSTGSRWERDYAKVFKDLHKQGNALFVDFLVISEFINTVLRLEWKNLQPASNFKDFRDSEDGRNTASDIFMIIKNDILGRFDIVGKTFNKHEIESLLQVDSLDFVDKSIVAICKENDLVLLTNDKDFNDADLDILTGNPNIFYP